MVFLNEPVKDSYITSHLYLFVESLAATFFFPSVVSSSAICSSLSSLLASRSSGSYGPDPQDIQWSWIIAVYFLKAEG
ncbi:hypothetical protein HAX54_016585, partial [Datura stramonium]|nr:hypothetical protein [Datura stramonium]